MTFDVGIHVMVNAGIYMITNVGIYMTRNVRIYICGRIFNIDFNMIFGWFMEVCGGVNIKYRTNSSNMTPSLEVSHRATRS